MKFCHSLLAILGLSLVLSAPTVSAQAVIEDRGVGMEREELEQVVRRWPGEMQRAAADDLGDRMELLNNALANKKLAMEADKLSPEQDPEAYWDYVLLIQRTKAKYVFDRYMKSLQVPDMSALAEERYATQKDEYALVEEKRLSSHILFMCPPGCPREPLRPRAAELLEKLQAGADWNEMVKEYSQDPNTKDRNGKLERWMQMGEPHVSPNFLGALFGIEKIGGYSGVVDTRYGLHIIRLDDIQEAYHKPFDEVREEIIQRLEAEYRELAAKEFQAGFRLSDEVRIDGEAMEEIFAPYKTTTE